MRYEDLNMSDFQGWIKLYRQIQNKGYYKKSHYVHLWVHLLLNANHKDNEFMWNGDLILIKEGQLLTGRKELSAGTGISQSTIERILKMLENEHQIMQRKTTKFRIITIINWKDFQGGQQTDNKRTTNGQQTDTNKNDKNEENEKKGLEYFEAIARQLISDKHLNKWREWVEHKNEKGEPVTRIQAVAQLKQLRESSLDVDISEVIKQTIEADHKGFNFIISKMITSKQNKKEGRTIEYNPA